MTEARYEFRSFAQQFGQIEAGLRHLGGTPLIRESQEVYLLSRAVDRNVKLREGVLDIKRRLAVEQGLEQWQPLLKAPLPLDAGQIRDVLLPALGITLSMALRPDPEDAEGLCAALRRPDTGVVVVDLFKRRFGFEFDGVQAEMAEVLVNGAAIRTVCIESVDADAVLQAVAALGLQAYGNVSYVQALQRITGLSPEPSFRA